MLSSKKISVAWYIVFDWLSAILTWIVFYGLRKQYLKENTALKKWLSDTNLLKGLIWIPVLWVIFYFLIGFYHSLYKKSRLNEITKLFFASLTGNIVLFFILILDDNTSNYHYYINAFLVLFLLHFFINAFFKFLILSYVKWQIKTGRIFFKTILIGNRASILKWTEQRNQMQFWNGKKIIGFLSLEQEDIPGIKNFGGINQLLSVLEKERPSEVIIAFDENRQDSIKGVIAEILGKNLSIKVVPYEKDFLTGAVKSTDILSNGLIDIKNIAMPEWQQNIKRAFDIVFSIFLLIVLSPLILFVALKTRWTNKGSILIKQERLGKHGNPFLLYKFRSMILNAEPNGPQLSSDSDTRITKWGKTMRKWRLDELPQLWNILTGTMSFVGPRPERAFYATQIMEHNPYYKLLYELKPGITSWGMVKFGYAENMEEMLERMQYDLLYANNASLLLDLKILLHTIRIILLGKGK